MKVKINRALILPVLFITCFGALRLSDNTISSGLLTSCRLKDSSDGLIIDHLTCEHRTSPLGIDRLSPQLSWMIKSGQRGQEQTAYHILAASSEEKLRNNTGDLWDSGKVPSGQSVMVSYDGETLQSGDQCYWKVMIWDKEMEPSEWSKPAFWSMGLLHPDDWKAQWISTSEEQTSPLFRQSFTIHEKPDQAIIYIASLGYFELYVNGQKVGDEVLAPAVSNFSKRNYYQTFDLREYLRKGENHLGIWMGTGWYTSGLPGVSHHSPVVRAQLELSDEGKNRIIVSDTSWETKPSARKRLGKWAWGDFGGEAVDARNIDDHWWNKEESTQGWAPAEEVDVAYVPCSAQPCRGNEVFDMLTPQSVEKLDEETILVDFGTNLTGLMEMTFHDLEPGQKISLYYGDLDGRDENETWRVSMGRKKFATYNQWDEFISAGAGEEHLKNMFNYHAFRYVLIEGLTYLPEKADMKARCIETKGSETGTFSCSNELFNSIHQMVKWTFRCLNLGGQTVDCPHRERLGYGDGQTIMDLGLYNFDAVSLYSKWSQNWWDEQGPDGFVPFTAPCPHNTGGGPAWGAMCIMVPWKNYLFSGDIRLLKDGYPYMKKYLEYLDDHCEDGLLQDIFPGEKWPNLGDWVPPRRGMDKQDWVGDSSRRLFNNCYRVYLLQIMQEVAALLEQTKDIEALKEAETTAQKKIHEKWFNPQDSTYANGEQPYLIFPLKTGVTPVDLKDEVFQKYIETLLVKDKGHLNTGMIGTQIMTDYLVEIGRNDLVDVFVNKKTYPGWGYMIEKGATTCWEQWNGYYSQIHSCFPYIGAWFYRGLAGIQWDQKDPGFKNVILRPGLVESVDWVKCSYESPYGEIVSNWKAIDDLFEWEISIPPNSTATVYIPGIDIRENGQVINDSQYITFLRQGDKFSVYRLESGNFSFSSSVKQEQATSVSEWSEPYRNWHYHPNLIIPGNPDIPGFEEVKMTDVPTVFQIPGNDLWYMTFIGFDGKGYQSFIAESKDLIHWENYRLAMGYGPEGSFDYGGVVLGAYLYEDYDIKAPRILKTEDLRPKTEEGKFYSLYGAYPRQGGYELRPGYEGIAQSEDGISWERAKDEPILSVYQDDCEEWEQSCIYQPWLLEHKGQYYNFYNAANGSIEQLGLAESSNLLDWKRYTKNPVIPNGPEGSYNEKFSSDIKVFWDSDHWIGFFFGVGKGGAHIMAARSDDLYNWTIDPEPLYIAGGNPSGIDGRYAHKISLVWNPENETYYMFYCAVDKDGNRGIGLLTSNVLDNPDRD